MEENCDVAPSAAAQNDMKQLRQLGRLELALCGLINRRSREALAIGVESALSGRLISAEPSGEDVDAGAILTTDQASLATIYRRD